MISLLTALAISFIFSPWFISKLRKKHLGQIIRDEGPKRHKDKTGTPTMGGGLIVFAVSLTALLWMDWSNHYLWCMLFVLLGYAILGFIDDYRKISKKNTVGISAKAKLFWQTIIAFCVCLYSYLYLDNSGIIHIPFLKDVFISVGALYIPFGVFVIVGTSNAVNLTDGLDGLAIGPVMTTASCYMILSYISGHAVIAEYLQLTFVPYTGELAIIAAAMTGAGLGFLWYNTYPAQVFMGDVGSLSLGGALGALAIFSKHEVLLALIGGIFVLEAVSVITQVFSFKVYGKRVFRMAPIHHHFELKGWAEPKIIVRFWIISIVLAILGLLSLKLR